MSDKDSSSVATSSESENLEALIAQNNQLQIRNEILTAFLKRCENTDLPLNDEEYPELAVEELNDIVSEEIEHIQQLTKENGVNGEERIREVKDHLQELENQVQEIKRDTHEFRRMVVECPDTPGPVNRKSTTLLKFMSDHTLRRQAAIDQILLRTDSQKSKVKQLTKQVGEKESGDGVRVIDFEQLKIENQQLLKQHQDRNTEVLHLKLAASSTIQRLNALRESLNLIESKVQKLNSNERIQETETEKCKLAVDKMQALNRRLDCKARDDGRRQFLTHDSPSILSYANLKLSVNGLKDKLDDLDRKLGVAEQNKM